MNLKIKYNGKKRAALSFERTAPFIFQIDNYLAGLFVVTVFDQLPFVPSGAIALTLIW